MQELTRLSDHIVAAERSFPTFRGGNEEADGVHREA
jgi:hypothetical protein